MPSCTLTVYYEYKLGNEVKELGGDIFDCTYCEGGSTDWIEGTIMSYDSIAAAKVASDLLRDCRTVSCRFPEPLGLYPVGKNKVHLLLRDRLSPLSKWLDQQQLWKFINGKCVGFSDASKAMFQDILLALEAIHSIKCQHHNVQHGIALGPDWQVKLYNVSPPPTDNGDPNLFLKKDFDDFLSFVLGVISKYPPLGFKDVSIVLARVDAVRQFAQLFCAWPKSSSDYQEYAEWLYRPFIFWRSGRKSLFFQKLYRILQTEKPGTSFHARLSMDIECSLCPDWISRIPPEKENNLRKTLSYSEKQYSTKTDLAKFIRNHDHVTSEKPFDDVDYVFPDALGAFYLALTNKDLLDTYLDGRQTKVRELLLEEPSIFKNLN